MNNTDFKTKKIVNTAMLIAMAVLLSLFQVVKLPFGGSVTLCSALPIVAISYVYGVKWGLFSAFCYSILQMLTGINTVSAFFLPGDSRTPLLSALLICIIDYVLAYTVLGFGGAFKGKMKSEVSQFVAGGVFALSLRYVMHVVSGAFFFGAWANWFFSDSTGLSQIYFLQGFCSWILKNFKGFSLSVAYSIIYNGCYMLPEIVLTAAVSPVVCKILKKQR